jgi:hypothetical protein
MEYRCILGYLWQKFQVNYPKQFLKQFSIFTSLSLLFHSFYNFFVSVFISLSVFPIFFLIAEILFPLFFPSLSLPVFTISVLFLFLFLISYLLIWSHLCLNFSPPNLLSLCFSHLFHLPTLLFSLFLTILSFSSLQPSFYSHINFSSFLSYYWFSY